MKYIYILSVLALGSLYSCQAVKPYQAQYLNDSQMDQGPLSIEKAESEGFNYREGSSGGEGGKIGGGCGCN
jgi:hypothetical protein